MMESYRIYLLWSWESEMKSREGVRILIVGDRRKICRMVIYDTDKGIHVNLFRC